MSKTSGATFAVAFSPDERTKSNSHANHSIAGGAGKGINDLLFKIIESTKIDRAFADFQPPNRSDWAMGRRFPADFFPSVHPANCHGRQIVMFLAMQLRLDVDKNSQHCSLDAERKKKGRKGNPSSPRQATL